MKKKAKFLIEVEYETNPESGAESIDVKQYEVEGDYKGITIALSAGLAFATSKRESAKSAFVTKVRLLRSVGSALLNILNTLKIEKYITDKDMDKDMFMLFEESIKAVVNTITTGISNALDIDKSEIKSINNEEYNKENNGNNGQEGFGQSTTEDFL